MKIFVYGTLRKGYGNHRLLKMARFIGTGKTGGKYHMFADGIPFVAHTGMKPSAHIVGEVYEVNKETVKRLDGLEGHPRWYKRERVRITLEDGSKVRAWLYFNEDPYGKEVVSGDYSDVRRPERVFGEREALPA